ncbi:HAD-IA family hydrolase [Isoptericola jiangsuensis]|uniref:HAD-IA family hydrolase n=1 Tax=Isoptericola jiangsuensis TaxID=548579 RepID=UPI003AAE04A8
MVTGTAGVFADLTSRQWYPWRVKPPAGAPGMPFDAVLCDIDGVIRFYDTDVVSHLEERAGLPVGTTAAIGFAPENDLPLLLGKITRAQWARSIVRALVPDVSPAEARALAEAFTGAESRTDETVVRLLRQVRLRCPVVLVSNAPVWLGDDLETLGLGDLADDVVNSSVVGVAKPDRRIFEIAARRAGVPASRCLFVDDRAENIAAAAELGMTTVLYRSAAGLQEALSPAVGAPQAPT